MFTVGLTGGIASGKSTVASLFANFGVSIIDTDQLAREVVQPGTPGLAQIQEHFGENILTAEGELDRAALREIVFRDPEQRQLLEQITHPLIRQLLAQRVTAAGGDYCIVEIPLLVESGWRDGLDRILVVDVAPEEQVRRAMKRSNLTQEQVEAIMRSQASRAQRLARADDVLSNAAGPQELREQVLDLHEKYLRLARARHG